MPACVRGGRPVGPAAARPRRRRTPDLPAANRDAAGAVAGSRAPRGRRRWLRLLAVAMLAVLFGAELVLAWPTLTVALRELRAPQPGWLVAALLAAIAAMSAYTRMQRRLLRSAGVRVPLYR